jgi:multiple antibiotic resistance protein
VQNAISNNVLKYKILSKFRLIKFYDYFLKILQMLSRKLTSFFLLTKDHEKVFFPYYSHFSHPQIKKRFYGKEAPQYWSTLESSKIVHCLQHSRLEYSGKKIIIEPNDNCLVIGGFLNTNKADELVSRSKEINDYICSSAVAKILVGNDELLNHASYYYSSDALKKFVTYPQMACVSAVTRNYLSQKNSELLSKRNIKYLSIASDFKIKAVDLLIEAFSESYSSGELTLVCHNVPENIRQKILANKNIFLIEDLPLLNKKKDQLYRDSDVYINTTYIDGGSVAWNALEYGLPIITHTYHRGKGLVEKYHLIPQAITIAGGLVLLISALRLIFPPLQPEPISKPGPKPLNLAISPLASPIIVTPMGIAAILVFVLFAHGQPAMIATIYKAIFIMMFLDFLVMFFIDKILKIPGLMAILQIMGSILVFIQVALAVQTILLGLVNIGIGVVK